MPLPRTSQSSADLSWMAHRRISVLFSHLRKTEPLLPPPPSVPQYLPPGTYEPLSVAASCCSSTSGGVDLAVAERGGERECIFCRIVRGESPAFKLYEDEVCICILDVNPLSFGHSLVIPKLHFPALDATPPPVVGAMCSKIPFLSSCIMKATQCDSFNLVVNNGKPAGQAIFHTHFHIIPRKAGDGLWCSDTFGRQPIEANQKIADLVSSVREMVSSPSQSNF